MNEYKLKMTSIRSSDITSLTAELISEMCNHPTELIVNSWIGSKNLSTEFDIGKFHVRVSTLIAGISEICVFIKSDDIDTSEVVLNPDMNSLLKDHLRTIKIIEKILPTFTSKMNLMTEFKRVLNQITN